MRLAADQQNLSPTKIILAAISVIATGALGGFLGDGLTKFFLEDAHPGAATIIAVLFCVMGVGVSAYYWIIFGYGGFEKDSPQRARYNRLKTSLRAGGRIGALYERMLRATLDATDRFFGDRDQPDRTLFPRAFGLKERAPLWTAQSFDCCLLVAFIYPIAVIFFVWAASGHSGPAEHALGLSPESSEWRRGCALGGAILVVVSMIRAVNARSWKRQIIWLGMALVGFSCALLGAGARGGSVPLTAFAIMAAHRAGFAFAVLFFDCTVAFIITLVSIAAGFSPTLAATLGVIALAVVGLVTEWAEKRFHVHLWLGYFLLLAIPVASLTALVAPFWMAEAWYWPHTGPILLFYGLLAVVNAPFDWITLGLTRALLRRGLELGGWWPLVFGLVDLFAAAIIVAALSVVTLLSVQLFGHFTSLGGGGLIVNVHKILAALAAPDVRSAPEYWWLYAMLFSTLIPSIINVALGALSLMRGIPGLHAGLARRMPVGRAVLESERMWMAPVLALQAMLGVAIGLIVMLGLIWILLEWALPLIGLNLVSMLQALAAADLPGRLLGLLGIG